MCQITTEIQVTRTSNALKKLYTRNIISKKAKAEIHLDKVLK